MRFRRERTHTASSLMLSLVMHGAFVVLLLFVASRAHPPIYSMQSGLGGDGIEPGKIEIAANVESAAQQVAPLTAPPVEQNPQSIVVESTSDSSALSSDGQSLLPPEFAGGDQSVFLSATSGVKSSAQFPRYSPAIAATSSESDEISKPGAGGLGGDGFATAAPDTSATNRPPQYPAEAQRRGISGRVVVRVYVLASGYPKSISVFESSGSSLLDDASVKAVTDWKFIPATDGSTAVDCEIKLPFDFVLHPRR